MLNATIDRFAFESISPHVDQVVFHAKDLDPKSCSRLHRSCCSRACRCAGGLRTRRMTSGAIGMKTHGSRAIFRRGLEPLRFVQVENDDRPGFRRLPPSSFTNTALANGALGGNVSSAGGPVSNVSHASRRSPEGAQRARCRRRQCGIRQIWRAEM